MIGSNMTPKELFRMNGQLPTEMVESLLEVGDKLETLKGVEPYLVEARGSFPAEDFMSPIIDQLRALQDRLRGENKQEMKRILEVIDDFQMTTFYGSEYGREQIGLALKEIAD